MTQLDARVEFLNKEMARGFCYDHNAEFCYWLLESDLYKQLTLKQVECLVDYIGESEHDSTDIPKEHWEHLVHLELSTVHNCLVCLTKWDEILEDYSYCLR